MKSKSCGSQSLSQPDYDDRLLRAVQGNSSHEDTQGVGESILDAHRTEGADPAGSCLAAAAEPGPRTPKGEKLTLSKTTLSYN
ncbi:hypothetical protein AV530_005648 [Patagioenas fasciata monilis]|uniref:Uncharacterized protein n=1 Tax=Patagioenas fasciata monilis TaxID=372326 RepID=A0A1V4JMJ7_PATFA|nr:hypothetical protein AV530_005648 [Patagioenas fasciata monilis]